MLLGLGGCSGGAGGAGSGEGDVAVAGSGEGSGVGSGQRVGGESGVAPCLVARQSQPRKGDVTGCQFGALGACPAVPGGCPHPTGWWGHPNHRQLPREVLGTRDPTTARHIRCLHGAVGLGPSWRRAGLQSAQGRKHAANCNGGRGEGCRVGGGPARLRLRMAILEQNAWARRSPWETVTAKERFVNKRHLAFASRCHCEPSTCVRWCCVRTWVASKSSCRFHHRGQACYLAGNWFAMFLRKRHSDRWHRHRLLVC